MVRIRFKILGCPAPRRGTPSAAKKLLAAGLLICCLSVPPACEASKASDLTMAVYTTTYPTGEMQTFMCFERLVRYLKNPPVDTRRGEFETTAQHRERVAQLRRRLEAPKRFTISFNPHLEQYSLPRQAFPLKLNIFSQIPWQSPWWDERRVERRRIFFRTTFYSKRMGFCISSNWWHTPDFEFDIHTQDLLSEHKTPITIWLLVNNIDKAKYLRENQRGLKANLNCVFIADFPEQQEYAHTSRVLGAKSFYDFTYVQYNIRVESLSVHLRDELLLFHTSMVPE